MNDVLDEVRDERKRQDEIWGEQNHNPFVWLSIIGEEKGEADEAALKAYFEGGKTLHDLRKELIEVAATAVSAIESLDRNELQQPSQEWLKTMYERHEKRLEREQKQRPQ